MSSKKEPRPLIIDCFNCRNLITVKYVRSTHNHSQKNNWGYWTEVPENKTLFVCDNCLLKLYRGYKWEFRQLIKSKQKKSLFRQYIINGTIKGQLESFFMINKNTYSLNSSKKKLGRQPNF